MWTFTPLFPSSQISPFKFREWRSASAPCSQPFPSLRRFIKPLFTPTPCPAQSTRPPIHGATCIPCFGNTFWAAVKGRGEMWKESKAPQNSWRAISYSDAATNSLKLSETLSNRVFSISHLQVGIFEAQETLKDGMKDGENIFAGRFLAWRNGCKTQLTEIAAPCLVVDQTHGDVPASSSPDSGVARLLALQIVPCDIAVRFLHNSHSKVGCFQKIK